MEAMMSGVGMKAAASDVFGEGDGVTSIRFSYGADFE
jgi:hypothetical protein